MQLIRNRNSSRNAPATDKRRGAILVLAAFFIAVVFAMTAFAVDLGYLSMTKTQLQSAADASALGAALELTEGLGSAPTKTSLQVKTVGNAAVAQLSNLHRNGDRSSTYVDTGRDVRYGQLTWDAFSGKWAKSYGPAPYNLLEVTLRRDQVASNLGDGRIPLMFGKSLGVSDAALNEVAAAGLLPGVGVRITAGSSATVGILPITLDEPTWNAVMAGMTSDHFSYNSNSGTICSGSDGVKEVDLYPYGPQELMPGNRGTLDIGSPANSSDDIKRQILYGLNAFDLSFYGGSFSTDCGPIQLNGDTGISAGIKAELEAIKGQPRLIPIFSDVHSPGNNAMYTIVKFVPIRILKVKLTGNPKTVVVQPAPFSSPSVIAGQIEITPDSYFTSPRLVE